MKYEGQKKVKPATTTYLPVDSGPGRTMATYIRKAAKSRTGVEGREIC